MSDQNDCKAIDDKNTDNKSEEEVVESETDANVKQETVVFKKREIKNWDKIVKEFEEEETKEKSEDADDLFKKLYADADEDTRRAMNKSFVESKGTTLSMDWRKVGKKYVKPYEDKGSDDSLSHSDDDSDEEMEGMRRLKSPKHHH